MSDELQQAIEDYDALVAEAAVSNAEYAYKISAAAQHIHQLKQKRLGGTAA